ncbi:MAG: sugar phosphate isomerase/epimerase family protein [Anaerolineae bacterium]
MKPPVALQLYSVRDYAEDDFEAAVRRVAKMGYAGVEPAGFPGTTPEAAGELFRELGLAVPSAHMAMPLGDREQEVIGAMQAIGSTRIISGQGPDAFSSLDEIKRTCERFNEAAAVARAHGMIFGVHNHWWEFTPVEGQMPYQVMLELLDPDIFFEVDTYWVQTAGADVVTVLEELGDRALLLHIKDGPCVRSEPMMAIGEGVMDFPRILAAADTPEWLIVELDRTAGDMMAAVEESVAYLIGEGLGRGRS